MTKKELCGNETWLYTQLTFPPDCKDQYGKILAQLAREGWEIHEKWNFADTTHDMQVYNPAYYGKITLKRKFILSYD